MYSFATNPVLIITFKRLIQTSADIPRQHSNMLAVWVYESTTIDMSIKVCLWDKQKVNK